MSTRRGPCIGGRVGCSAQVLYKRADPISVECGRSGYMRTGPWALWRFLQPYRWQATGLVALGILALLFGAVGVSLIIPVLQALSGQTKNGIDTGEEQNFFSMHHENAILSNSCRPARRGAGSTQVM